MTSSFGNLDDRDQRELVNKVWAFADKAEERHQQILDRFDLLIGAFAAGMRAAADALDRGRR